MYIDLSRIPRDKPAAVEIPTKECGEAFLSEMRLHYPEKVKAWTEATYVDDICYIPHFENGCGMTLWTVHSARDSGYRIILWEEISPPENLETCLSEYNISMLLG